MPPVFHRTTRLIAQSPIAPRAVLPQGLERIASRSALAARRHGLPSLSVFGLQNLPGQILSQSGHVFALFEQDAGRVGGHFGVDGQGIKRDQGLGPLDALGDARDSCKRVFEGRLPELGHKLRHLPGQLLTGLRHLRPHDGQLALAVGVVEPVVKASALDGIVELARAVAGENGHRGHVGLDSAELGDADLVLAEVFELKGLNRLVGAIDVIDEQT